MVDHANPADPKAAAFWIFWIFFHVIIPSVGVLALLYAIHKGLM